MEPLTAVRAPRALFLTCHLPFPPMSGGRRREYELIRRLSGEFEVHVCAVTKTPEEDRRHLRELRRHGIEVTLLEAAGARAAPAVRGREAPQVARHRCPRARGEIARLLAGGFDLVHVEGFYLVQHLPRPARTPVLLVEQNVEYELWLQRAETAETAAERQRLLAQAAATRTAELSAWEAADTCATVTEEDRERLLAAIPDLDVRVVPDGCDHLGRRDPRPRSRDGDSPPTLVMVGNFAYEPNVDAALHLCHDILPRVLAAEPGVRVVLVGASPPDEVAALARKPGVSVTGTVPAIEPYLDAADVVVCPLRIGGGIKVKVLEALGRGCAIVTTPVGAQGLAGDGLRVEAEPDGFAAAVVDLVRSPEERRRLRRAAAAAAKALPSWDRAADALAGCWWDLSAAERRTAA